MLDKLPLVQEILKKVFADPPEAKYECSPDGKEWYFWIGPFTISSYEPGISHIPEIYVLEISKIVHNYPHEPDYADVEEIAINPCFAGILVRLIEEIAKYQANGFLDQLAVNQQAQESGL